MEVVLGILISSIIAAIMLLVHSARKLSHKIWVVLVITFCELGLSFATTIGVFRFFFYVYRPYYSQQFLPGFGLLFISIFYFIVYSIVMSIINRWMVRSISGSLSRRRWIWQAAVLYLLAIVVHNALFFLMDSPY